MNDYVILTDSQLKVLQQQKDQYLTVDQVEYLSKSKEYFFKYLDYLAFTYKLDLGEGKYEDKEQEVYFALETFKKIKEDIKWMETKVNIAKQTLKDKQEGKDVDNLRKTHKI